ncbi:MAG: ATP-grasp domain-containing protein [Terracidiphilus sp.]
MIDITDYNLVNIAMPLPLGCTIGVESRKRPAILVAATLWWQLSARLAIGLLDHGCLVSAICPKGHLLRYVEGLDRVFPYHSLNSLASLEDAIRQTMPDVVVPCDDRVVWQLHELHRLKPDLRPLIETSLGAADGFELVEHRDLLLDVARSLGILVPATKRITSAEEIHTWFASGEGSAVLKLDGTWGGEGVMIAHSEQEAKDAFRRFSRPTGIVAAIKRLVVNRDPLSLWNWSRQAQPAIIIQGFIHGWPANSMLACWEGEILSMVSVEVLASQGATGAALMVRQIENDDMTKAARLLAKRLRLNGFCGLDFQVDRLTGRPHLIEMNPRCTQLGHLPLNGGSDLAGALCAKLGLETSAAKGSPLGGQVVAFFPQAARWNLKSPLPSDIYNDVPQGQPKLIRELMQTSWPERQLISRVYHFFHPSAELEPVEFDLKTG